MTTNMKPNFIVIGAARSGTTSLFQYLDPHPEVYMSQVKELNFFSNESYWNRGFDWYEARFQSADGVRAVGEASTSYTKAPFTPDVVKRIHDYSPDMRLIYVVRDPIDRYVSHFLKRTQTGVETRPFEATLKDLEQEACAWQGRYHYQLQQYLTRFPREQIRVISMDDLKTNPGPVVHDLYRFLGVDPDFKATDFSKVHNANERIVRKSRLGLGILSFYRSHIEHREWPFRIKKQFSRLADLGGTPVTKPALDDSQFRALQAFYEDDARRLEDEFGISTHNWMVRSVPE